MDKTRDVRRGASRFSRQVKQSGHKLISGFDGVGGDCVSLEKSKKEKLRRLSLVGKANSSNEDCVMGCDASDRENELPSQAQSMTNGTSKRFKLPKKFLDDCNGVDHACVPRKLRSAMKKRNPESASAPLPDSKKVNHRIGGVEFLKKDVVKKPKLNMKGGVSDCSIKQTASGLITKDEEEVVETLYALAGMFPDNDTTDKSKLVGASLEANPPDLPVAAESSAPAFEDSAVTKEDVNLTCPSRTAEAAPSSNIDRSPKEIVNINSWNELGVQEGPGFPSKKIFPMESESSVPQVKLNSMVPSIAKNEHYEEKPLCDPVNFHVLPELNLDSGGLKQPTQQETLLFERKPEIELGAAAAESQLAQQHLIKESRKNGLALWPGLSSTVSPGAGSHGPLQCSAAKIPAWLDAAMCSSRPRTFENGSTGKVSKLRNGGKSLKRCAAHVYISRLIQSLQMPESEDRRPLQPNQLMPHEGSKQEVLVAVNDFNRGLNGVIPGSSVGNSTAERNPYGARSGILQNTKLHQEQPQPQAAPASGLHISQKQSFDFLSLSTGGCGVEATSSFNKARNGMEALSQLQVPCLSLPQHHTFMPFSMPQTRYTSAYADQLSAAATTQQVQLQLPPYLGSPFCCPPRISSTAMARQQQQQRQQSQQQQQQQQQQQGFWAAQLAAQYRPAVTSTAMTQFPSWQSGRQDSMPIPCAQAIIPPPPPPSLEILGPKYSPISQQQQQLMAITSSFPPARLNRHDHHISSGYDETGGGFHAAGALPLQLLCNERL